MTEKKIMDRNASDNEYMHKDFHGALCYAIKYLDDNYGTKAIEEYLQQVARTYFAPLSDKLKSNGLKVLEDHWQNVFTKEGGEFDISYDNDTLVLEVAKCPAVNHLKEKGMLYTDDYCLTTVIVNKTICQDAGFDCSCKYEAGKGKCVQKFWRKQK